MNILFLIGNGFDINLGMQTRYQDFYKHYLTIPSSSSIIEDLKKNIKKDIENWSDLEKELGVYTKELIDENEFREIYDDLSDRLGEYLEKVEEMVDIKIFDKKKLFNFLSHPENSLTPGDINTIASFRKNWKNVIWNTYIISFNYTEIFEKIFEYKGIGIDISDTRNGTIVLQKIEHIHGYINDRMVMGVNDISQISNKEFKKNQNILIDFVKPECNKVQKHLVDETCKSFISSSNLICIFGSSLGETDNLWWEAIGEQLKRDCFLIIFDKTDKINSRRPQRKAILESTKSEEFLNKTKLTEEEKSLYKEKIIVGINTNMFDIKI